MKAATLSFIKGTHRRLPKVQGAMTQKRIAKAKKAGGT